MSYMSLFAHRVAIRVGLHWPHLHCGAHNKDVLDRLLEHIGLGFGQTSTTYGLLFLPLRWDGQSAAMSPC